MQNSINQCEYIYTNSNAGHHHSYLLKPLLELISQQVVTSNQNYQILDLGCGNGSLTQKIAQYGYSVIGVEDSASGIQAARNNVPECQFIQSSIYSLPYSELEHRFDIVISTEVIEHLLYPRELLQAAKRCLKPGGRLILTTPYHGYAKNLMLSLSGKMDGHFTVLWDGGHIKFFSVKTLTQLLQKEGLTDIHFKFSGRLPYLWKSMLCSSVLAED